jgi:hypothetical protein
MAICSYWIQKSLEFIFLITVYREKKFAGHTKPKTLDKKIREMAKFRLVKIFLSKNYSGLQYLDICL